MERIEGQCPCGQPLVALIFPPRTPRARSELRFFALTAGPRPGLKKLQRIRRCPVCDRDFSELTAEQLKENAWPT